ncbi:uncharacterized protein tasor2 isoform X1 [Astyanax mexicanus]|uniref:uncharacterized protein tasor2 isoform X1 n=2 Tax=Astyanax mexicanus TaxID=7994 RepID=UPI0020CAFB6A|nr:uncharacterized protein tasor2 isoform X1 [Astyanax mexicanus]
MENDATLAKEGLLEPVLPGSVTFDSSILAPLRNNYLYEESNECFTYSSAYLINSAKLQERYSAFRAEKQKNGYSKGELEESFGFLLFDEKSRANTLADNGLMVGQGTCTILGDSSKGVYISKYSDCLDLKRWYDGKTGYIVLLKLTKGRVKEVTENYTQNFTPPTAGFDCHVSDQLGAVCATTSSFLAFERTQYYLYELLDGGNKPEPCPRHVCPFAVVAFSYGKTSTSLQLKEKSQEKTSFHYQPWSGQLKIESVVYNVGLQSIHGATFPANLSKTVKVDHAIGVSELRKTLPQSIFETSFLGEVSLDSRCFRLYDVVSLEEKSDLSLLTQELKEKDLALVVCLDDGGFLIILHSSHFLSYEGVGTDKASGLQGLFIFPDSRTVPRETKRPHSKPKISAEVLRVLPALNYAESEMEKCPSSQQGEPLGTVEKHLQNFATLILPGLSSSPAREASMFPDQYDVPDGFPLIAPKWTEGAGACLKKYLNNPCGFVIPVARAVELLVPEKQQRSDDDHDDDVYYYISSPEEAPQTPAGVAVAEEGDVAEEAAVSGSNNEEVKTTTVVKEQTENQKEVPADVPHSALQEEDGTPGTVVVVVSSENPLNRTDSSPTSRELLEQSVEMVADSEKTPENVSANDANEHSGDTVESPQEISKETPLQTTSEPLTEEKSDVSSDVVAAKVDGANPHPEVEAEMLDDDISGSIPVVDKDVPKEADLPMSVSASTPSEKQIEELVVESEKVEPLTNSTNVLPHKKRNTKHLQGYRRRKRKGLKRSLKQMDEASAGPDHNTTTNTTPGQSSSSELVVDSSHSDPLRKDWRSLPRRKKLWSPDDGKKRALRSIVKSSETSETSVEKSKSPTITEPPSITESSVSSTPKRKMEGFNMRERYGLKTIITDCGFVFVPHGSEVAEADIKTSQDLKESKDSSLVSTTSPVKDKPEKNDSPIIPFPLQLDKDDQHSPLTHILQNLPINTAATAPSSQQIYEKDSRSVQKNTEQSPTPEPKKSVYKAISISKLKTVLKRARQTKSQEKSESDNTEPELKKDKPSTDVDLNKSESGKLSPLKEVNKLTANEPSKTTPSKKVLVSWRELKSPPSHEKLKPKENGCIMFGPSAPNELVKQAGPQPVSALTGNRVVGKAVSSESKSSKAALATSPPLHSDALNLLADLALSANSEKMLPNPAKARKKSHAGAKTSNSPESVLHALLRGSSAKLKLPPQSPFPESLLVPGELLLEISKEHSYSQPTSLLSGSSGAPPQFRPPAGSVGSLLSLDPKLHLKLPHHSSGTIYEERGGKNGWRHRASLDVPHPSSRVQRPRSFHHRHVIEKDGLLQVARLWKEKYDCRFDSRFTNDALEKSVTRALHGKWDFGIEDTFEQVHLIFHMWIGLFYSKRTSRFFHFDQNCAPLEKKDPPHVPNTISPIQAASKQPGVHLSSKEDKDDSLRPAADILDLSVKTSGPSSNCTVTQGNSKERPATSSDTKTSLVNTTESKKPSTTDSSHQAPNVPTKLPAVDDRPAVKPAKDSLVMDVDESDGENDASTETPYTKLLEKNSAYSNLCEQASNMHIEDLKSLKGQMNAPVCNEQKVPEALNMTQTSMKVAPCIVPTFDPRSLTVFHQVLLPIGPVILLKTFDPAPERKIILGPQSIKDNTGAVTVPALRPKEVVSKAQGGAALQTLENNNPSRSVVSDGSNVKKNAQTKVISVLDGKDKTSVDTDKNSPRDKERSEPDIKENTPMSVELVEIDQKPVLDVTKDIPVDESLVKAKDEITPTRDGDEHAQNDGNDATADAHTVQTTDKEMQMPEVKDPTSKPDAGEDVSMHDPKLDARKDVSMHDEKNVNVRETNNKEKQAEVIPVDESSVGKIADVQDVIDNTEVGDGLPESLQNVDDEGKTEKEKEDEEEEIRPKPDVVDRTSVDEGHDDDQKKSMEVEMNEMVQEDAAKNDLNVLEENEKIDKVASDKIKESHECEKTEEEQHGTACDDHANSELDSDVHVSESRVSTSEKDCTDCVDMEISDGKDSEDESQVEELDEKVDSSSVKLQERETRAETSVVDNNDDKHTDDCNVQEESTKMADNLSAENQSLKKDHSDTSIQAESKSEGVVLDQSPQVQNKAPEISPTKSESVYSEISPRSTPTSPESGEIIESSDVDSTKAADEDDDNDDNLTISNTSVAQVQEADSSKEIESKGILKDENYEKRQHSSDSGEVSPASLEIDTENEINSRSCTPTQDELPYSLGGEDDLRIQRVLQLLDFHTPANSSPTACTGIESDGSVCSTSSSGTGTHNSSSPGSSDRAQSFSEGTPRSTTKQDTEEKVPDRSKAFVSDAHHVPKKGQLHFHQVKELEEANSPARGSLKISKDIQLQKDQSDLWSKQHEAESWMRGSSFSTDEPYNLREPYACDEDPEAPLAQFRNSTSIHRELAQKPREATESDSDIPDWVHDFHYAASTSTVAKPNKRAFPFRHQDDDSDSSGSSDDSDVCYRTKKRKKASSKEKWDEASTYSINKTISSGVDRTKTLRTVTCSPYHQKRDSKQSFDWHRYFRREGIFDAGEKNHTFVQNPPSSIVTVLDKEGNRVIYENASSSKRSSGATGGRLNTDNTQSVMEQEYLVFSENMNQMVKSCKASSSREKSHHRSSLNPAENLMTIQFSRLDEQESSSQFDGMWPSLTNFKINVDMSERKGSRETGSYGKPLHLQSLFCESSSEASCSKISDISKECAKSYSSMMNDVCTKKKLPHQKGKMQRKWDSESTPVSKQPAFCGRIKKAMFDHLHDNLNSIVRQSCKIKYKFFILVTSDDPFFKETKDLLEAEGHTAVEPYEFDIDDNEQTPLIIIIRNEDIAEHICEVPHLLDLKKSSRVLFAGIDQPDDVVNLTHQELFAKGGFVVVDETAFDTLSLEHMKKVMGIMEELDKKGKWKWFLHYRDSRKLRENARCSPEAQMKKHFMDCCQEAGIVEVLPYHECDVISRDRPDYLRCLVRLQIQNASARFPVFITDTQTESFGKNGILTMNIYTLSRILSNDTCSVS